VPDEAERRAHLRAEILAVLGGIGDRAGAEAAKAQLGSLVQQHMAATSYWSWGAVERGHDELTGAGSEQGPGDELIVGFGDDPRDVATMLVEHPGVGGQIVDTMAVGCVITPTEAERLSDEPSGWDGFAQAGIDVFDLEATARVDLRAAARRQSVLVRRLASQPSASQPSTSQPSTSQPSTSQPSAKPAPALQPPRLDPVMQAAVTALGSLLAPNASIVVQPGEVLASGRGYHVRLERPDGTVIAHVSAAGHATVSQRVEPTADPERARAALLAVIHRAHAIAVDPAPAQARA
jgi:hypothetical protein